MKGDLYLAKKGEHVNITTLKKILTVKQYQELFSLLVTATNNSTVDSRFQLAFLMPDNMRSKKIEEYAADGSYAAHMFTPWEDFIGRAKAGDPYSQLKLGLKYLNFVSDDGLGCDATSKEKVCQQKNEVEGYRLLKQALKTYERRGHDELYLYAFTMCDFFRSTANKDEKRLEQAYQWGLFSINTGSLSGRCLNTIKQNKEELAWDKLMLTDLHSLPEWVAETRKELARENLPVFSYYVEDYMEYELDVYADGLVKIGVGLSSGGYLGHTLGSISLVDSDKDVLMRVSPETVKRFLAELEKIGYYRWKLNSRIGGGLCDHFDPSGCLPKRYQVVTRDGASVRRVYMSGHVWDIANFGNTQETKTTKQIAKISTLIEKYFPTRQLRCELGNSEEFRQACFQRDARWHYINE